MALIAASARDDRRRLIGAWVAGNAAAGLLTALALLIAATLWPISTPFIVPVISPYAVLLVWGVFAFSFGSIQRSVLRRRWKVSPWWLVLSPGVGLVVPALLLVWVIGRNIGLGDVPVFVGAFIAGIIIGAAQLMLLHPMLSRPGAWLVGNGLGCLLAVAVFWASAVHVFSAALQLTISSTLAATLYGLATSPGLWAEGSPAGNLPPGGIEPPFQP